MESYLVAGIDVHKKMLAVVVTDAAAVGEYRFARRRFGTGAAELKALAEWLAEQQVQEAVMESTAQYWRPVWQALERQCRLQLAQAHSNRAPKGRKRDFADAERLVRRHIAGELILSFVPGEEQRLWRTMTRTKQQLTRDRVRLQNQMEAFLEEARIKLSSHMTDLFGVSGLRMLYALAEGETDAARIAALATRELRASQESAEISKSNQSPKGNRSMRRILTQAAHAAVKAKGSVFEALYRRLVPRLGRAKAIWAVAHRLCRIAWKILHAGVPYEERGYRPNRQAIRQRANRLIRDLRRLGYQVQVAVAPEAPIA